MEIMDDWPAAATDLRAAYVASNGKAPWILGRAAWSTASNTDGLPQSHVLGNYKVAEGMLNEYLRFLEPLAKSSPDDWEIESASMFALWELAQILLWRFNWMHPELRAQVQRSCMFKEIGKIPAASSHEACDLLRRASECKARALAAEDRLDQQGMGIMNCYAREAVLDLVPALEQRFLKTKNTRSKREKAASRIASEQQRPTNLGDNTRLPTALAPNSLSSAEHCEVLACEETESGTQASRKYRDQ